MAKHVFKRGQDIPDKRIMHPKREWGIALLISVFILIIGISFSAERYLYFFHLEDNLAEQAQEVIVYKGGTMQKTLQIYESRAIEFAAVSDVLAPALETQVNQTETTTTASSSAEAVVADEDIEDDSDAAGDIELSNE